jgi:hypothetical protein
VNIFLSATARFGVQLEPKTVQTEGSNNELDAKEKKPYSTRSQTAH